MVLSFSGFISKLFAFEGMDVARAMRWVVNLVACSCGLLSGALFWKVYILVADKGVEVPTIVVSNPPALTNPGWGSWLDLVQSVPQQSQQSQPAQQQVKQIDTSIELVGIIGMGSSGIAIMRVDGRPELVYAQGDTVDDDVVLKQVLINGVVLSNGQTEREYIFPEIDGLVEAYDVNEASLPQASPIVAVGTPSQKAQPITTHAPRPAPQPRVAFTPQTKKQIQELREQPLKATQYADAQIVRRDGKILGLQIGKLRNPELFAALGLLRDDVVLSVNGKSVADLARDPVGAQAMLQQKSFRLEILRQGNKQTLDFSWPQ